nr:hypothetical protein CFP56_19572 [Quercus suber]
MGRRFDIKSRRPGGTGASSAMAGISGTLASGGFAVSACNHIPEALYGNDRMHSNNITDLPLFSARRSPTEKDLRCCLDVGGGDAGVAGIVAAVKCSAGGRFMMDEAQSVTRADGKETSRRKGGSRARWVV